MNNPRISAGQPTNILASLDALTQFIKKAKGFKKRSRISLVLLDVGSHTNEAVEKVGFDYSQHRLSLNFNCPQLCLDPRCFAKFFTPSFDFPVFGFYLAGGVYFDGLVRDDFEVWFG